MTPDSILAVETARRVWSYPPARILAAVDFGPASGRAVQVAGVLARQYSARLTALHADVIEAPVYFTHDQETRLERQRVAARAAAEQQLLRFVRQAYPDRVTVRIADDAPASAIVDAANGMDLIVMGTHGRHGPSRWWLGSVAERVVRESVVPVLIVRADTGGSPPQHLFDRIVMVAGSGALEGDAHRYATGLATAFDGTIAGEIAARPEDVAREQGASLLVVARQARGSGFGGPAERLVRLCTLPLLFVPGRA